jgi:hypothetical protein
VNLSGQTRKEKMFTRIRSKLRFAFFGGAAAAVIAVSAAGATDNSALVVGQTNSATLQTALQGSMASPVLLISNFSTASGAYGLSVNGNSNTTPAIGGGNSGSGVGFRGLSLGGIGALGIHNSSTGTAAGVQGETNSTTFGAAGILGRINPTSPGGYSAGVHGINNGTNTYGFGVWGEHLGGGIGVLGESSSGPGVKGDSSSGIGVWGHSATRGVVGTIDTSCAGSYGVGGCALSAEGVHGVSSSGSGVHGKSTSGDGVLGESDSQPGVYGYSNSGSGVVGESTSGYAGYFFGWEHVTGNLEVGGTLSKAAGSFKIDHPLQPASAYLQHSFVESPDMMNVYDGNVTTDGKGFATVRLPRYFQALNKDFRYQLTPIGHNAWGAQAIVWNEIRDNRFTIRSEPHVKISWQVTGIRHDRYANAHRIKVVVPKAGADNGKYLHPELYGKPASLTIGKARPPRPPLLSPSR